MTLEYDRQNETFSYKEYQNEIIIRNISDIDGDFWQNFEACGIDDITKHFHEDSLFNLNSSKWRKTPYEYYMNHLEGNSSENALYFLKDIDNNGIVDLILLKNSMFTIYTYNGNITKMCEHDFVIGTARWFSSDNPEYPGIFYMTVGGSAEHHGYMYLKNGELCFEDLWVEKYTDTAENIIENISDNSDLVEESKKLYANGKDIDFKLIS